MIRKQSNIRLKLKKIWLAIYLYFWTYIIKKFNFSWTVITNLIVQKLVDKIGLYLNRVDIEKMISTYKNNKPLHSHTSEKSIVLNLMNLNPWNNMYYVVNTINKILISEMCQIWNLTSLNNFFVWETDHNTYSNDHKKWTHIY